jgi:branched-chain amino acid transport system permease protein
MLWSGVAGAESAPTTAPPPEGPAIFGELTSGGEPIVGVEVMVTREGQPVGSGTSDGSGRFVVPLAESGRYEVSIDPATIPSGFELRDPERTTLDNVVVFGTSTRRVLFPFSGDAAVIERDTRFERFANLIAAGILRGLLVGICAVGLSLIFSTTGLVNFAHGELVTFGALVAWFFNTSAGGPRWPLWLAAVAAVVAGGLFGAALERGLWRPLVRRRSGRNSRMLVAIGLALFLRYTFQIVYGAAPRVYRQFSGQGPTDFGPISMPARDYAIIAISAVALVLVALVLLRTRLGTAIRAVADERDLASASGIAVDRVVLTVWVIGAASTALGGVLLATTEAAQWNMGFNLLLTMFAAVVLGGLSSPFGAMAGGLVVGVAQELGTYWIPTDFKLAIGLVMLIIVLLVRPQGVLGIKERLG